MRKRVRMPRARSLDDRLSVEVDPYCYAIVVSDDIESFDISLEAIERLAAFAKQYKRWSRWLDKEGERKEDDEDQRH